MNGSLPSVKSSKYKAGYAAGFIRGRSMAQLAIIDAIKNVERHKLFLEEILNYHYPSKSKEVLRMLREGARVLT